jgi:hypothetical protein
MDAATVPGESGWITDFWLTRRVKLPELKLSFVRGGPKKATSITR